MALNDALDEAAQLEERRDLGNVPREPVQVAPEQDDEPQPETPDVPEQREDGDPVQLRQQLEQATRELELARASYRQPEPPQLPHYDATNILPIAISEDVIESWGLPRAAAKQINDFFTVAALSAKNAAVQELSAAYGALQQQQAAQQQMRARFYTEHKDLEAHQAYVGYVAQQVKAEYPQAPESLLLPAIAQRARQQLKANGLLKAPRRRRPAMSDSPGSSVGARPSSAGSKSYSDRLLEKLSS